MRIKITFRELSEEEKKQAAQEQRDALVGFLLAILFLGLCVLSAGALEVVSK